jgi:uncharacterized cupredoxin-like copper-binding protein
MKLKNALAALCLLTVSAGSFAFGPDWNYDMQYTASLRAVSADSTTQKPESFLLNTADGATGIAGNRQKTPHFTTKVEGNKTTTKSDPQMSGTTVAITPAKMARGDYEKTKRVSSEIKIDHAILNKEGLSVQIHQTFKENLEVGKPTTLSWSNDGEKYQLTVTLDGVKPVPPHE